MLQGRRPVRLHRRPRRLSAKQGHPLRHRRLRQILRGQDAGGRDHGPRQGRTGRGSVRQALLSVISDHDHWRSSRVRVWGHFPAIVPLFSSTFHATTPASNTSNISVYPVTNRLVGLVRVAATRLIINKMYPGNSNRYSFMLAAKAILLLALAHGDLGPVLRGGSRGARGGTGAC